MRQQGRKSCPALSLRFSNPQRDGLRESCAAMLCLQTSLRRLFSDETNARQSLAAGFPKIERAEQIHRRGELKCGVILLLGDEGIDHGGMLVPVASVFLMLMRHGMILLLVAGGGMRSVAVIHCKVICSLAAAVAQIAAMQAKRLRPADREKRDPRPSR
jgi:hypothetical protein